MTGGGIPARWLRQPLAVPGLFLLFFVLHLYRITDGPNGFHTWRETDTAMVAANFFTETGSILEPRIDVRGAGDGRIGMEFPLYSYWVGFLFHVAGHHHSLARLSTVAAALLLLWLTMAISRRLSGDRLVATCTLLAMACSPLVFFYGRKIQPDIWALTATTAGFWCLLTAPRGRWSPRFLGFIVLFCLGGLMKPTMLVLGSAALWVLLRQEGRRGFGQPRWWVAAALILTPVLLWYRHARQLNLSLETNYFYLGGRWDVVLDALSSYRFWQNSFLAWPFELGTGLLLAPFFLYGLVRLKQAGRTGLVLSWAAGCYAGYFITARHMATPHDYYMLSLTPALALVTGEGLAGFLTRVRTAPVLQMAGMALILLAMPAAIARVHQRYGPVYDFADDRRLGDRLFARGERIAVMDDVPARTLYRLGRKGWRLQPGDHSTLEEIRAARVRWLAVSATLGDAGAAFSGGVAFRNRWVTVYRLEPERPPLD